MKSVCQFCVAVVTNYHKFSALKEYKLIVQFCRSKISLSGQKSQKCSRAALLLETLGEICVLASPAFRGSCILDPSPCTTSICFLHCIYFSLWPARLPLNKDELWLLWAHLNTQDNLFISGHLMYLITTTKALLPCPQVQEAFRTIILPPDSQSATWVCVVSFW